MHFLRLFTAIALCSLAVGCGSTTPNILLKHIHRYPDGSEQLEQVLRYGGDSVATLVNVRATIIAGDAAKGSGLRMKDGTALSYSLVLPSTPFDASRLVLFLRERDAVRYDWSEEQLRLAQRGCPSLSLDLRGVGTSGGMATYGLREREDVLEAIEAMRRNRKLGDSGVAIVARTFGTGVAVQTAAIDRGRSIRALVLEGAYPKLAPMMERLLPAGSVDSVRQALAAVNVPIDSLNPAHWLPQLHDLPVLFIWGERDQYLTTQERGVTALLYAPADDRMRSVATVKGMYHTIDRDPLLISEEEYQGYLGAREHFIALSLPLK